MEGLGKRDRELLERMGGALDRLDDLLYKLGRQGLQRMTSSSAVELQGVSQTAHAAGLIRIERELEALGTYVARYLGRDPLFRMADYVGALNRIWLLVRATRKRFDAGESPEQLVDLIGEARRRYEVVDAPLPVQPVAASGWVTETDFVGITIYLHHAGELLQASLVRPVMAFGNDPRRLLFQPVSEYLTVSMLDLAHRPFTLHAAKRSHDGRLSLHRDLTLSPAPDLGAAAFAPWFARDWVGVLDRLRDTEVSPIGGAGGAMVYVEPAGWGSWTLDDKRSRARLALHDGSGGTLWAQVRLSPENNLLVDNLAALHNDSRIRPRGLFGRAYVADGELRLQPFTGVWERPLTLKLRTERQVHQLHLTLEPVDAVRFS